MDTDLINKYRDRFQRPVKKEVKTNIHNKDETVVYTDTPDRACVFLKIDNTCAIYEDRPYICQIFGLRGGELECPNVSPSGRIRSEKEKIRAKKRITDLQKKNLSERINQGGITMRDIYYENDPQNDPSNLL
jgi:Fe-S-cluster containining protein